MLSSGKKSQESSISVPALDSGVRTLESVLEWGLASGREPELESGLGLGLEGRWHKRPASCSTGAVLGSELLRHRKMSSQHRSTTTGHCPKLSPAEARAREWTRLPHRIALHRTGLPHGKGVCRRRPGYASTLARVTPAWQVPPVTGWASEPASSTALLMPSEERVLEAFTPNSSLLGKASNIEQSVISVSYTTLDGTTTAQVARAEEH